MSADRSTFLRDSCAASARDLRRVLACSAVAYGAVAVIIPFDGGDLLHSFAFGMAATGAAGCFVFVGMAEKWRALAHEAGEQADAWADELEALSTPSREDRP